MNESIGLMIATELFEQHVGNLIFPSRPLSPKITEHTLMAVRQGFIKAFEQVNAEIKGRNAEMNGRIDSVQGTTKSVGAEKQTC